VAIPPQEVPAERASVAWAEAREANGNGNGSVTPRAGVAPLRIRQLELVGFKSFRDRTVLHFPVGVTAVVGPNGCGKSNVVDAIRWVLGEQSAKRLRGEGMEDVIFGGNDRHAPLGMAQVSIVFETDGLPLDQFSLLKEAGHPIATAGPADIMATRRYLRSGESEYLLNGVPCRLRDITELFLGTGLGGKAYAIIEQGRVEQLVGAKPEDLRLFIEEAAGTTLYRSRRQMAERKMERTRENLLRVQDILREVERQLAGLRRQARRAEQYRALQAEIEVLDLALSVRARARLGRELADLVERRSAALAREAQLVAALAALESTRRAAREREGGAQRQLRESQAAAYEARAAVEAARHEEAHLQGRLNELGAQRATTERDLTAAQAERAAADAEGARLATQLTEVLGAIVQAERVLAEGDTEFARAAAELGTATRALDAAKDTLVGALTDEARARNAVSVVQQRRQEEGARVARLETGAATLAGREAELAVQAEEVERHLVELQTRLEALAGTKGELTEDLRRVLAERASWEHTLEGVKDGLARIRSRRDSLRELQDSRAGYGEGVRAVLAASAQDEVLGLVAEVLEIPAEHERAVAAALGEHLQAVVMRDHDVAREAVQALRRAGAGRATCLPNQARSLSNGGAPDGGTRLLDVVKSRQGYESVASALLGNVLLIDDLATALATWRQADSSWTYVTPAGETVDPRGAVTGGNQRSEETLLAQRRELRDLEHEVQRKEEDLARVRRRHEELSADVTTREAALREIDAELAHVAVDVVAAEKDVQRLRRAVEDVREQARDLTAELDEGRTRLGDLIAEADRSVAELVAAEGSRRGLEEGVTRAEAGLAAAKTVAAEWQAAGTDRRVALAEERTRREALENAIERLGRVNEEAARRVALLEERRQADAAALDQTRDGLTEVAGRLSGLEVGAEERAAVVMEAERTSKAAREAAEACEGEIAAAQADLECVRGEAAALEVQATERRLAVAHLDQAVQERYQRELAEVPDEGEVAEPEAAAREERLALLRQRVTAMGDVNVGALGEVAELEERQRFLESQRTDLEQALEDLKKTIARLNRTSRARFRETFERVDETFREVFPKLFGGGKAQLRLTNEEQILDSGVEIIVQPPGKRIGPLDLLSGGEKALTAVSLIFALFLIRPSPFCFLDEVDAPLDDANIGRFNSMVREMSAHSQFILITHNKHTMEVAETLYGITMEEPGVSRVVSVRLPG